MNKPKLFISYSEKGLTDKDRSVLIRKSLSRLLKKEWEVFLYDEILEPGDKWRSIILHNLVEAQAGIILFNEPAIESPFVKAEALILSFKKYTNPEFQLIPVLLDGKKIKDPYFELYEPFQLKEIQFISDDDRRSSPNKFAGRIAKIFNPPSTQSYPTSPWVIKVNDILKDVEVDALVRAAEYLGFNKEEPKNRLLRIVVELMYHKSPLECVFAFRELLNQLSIEKKIKILRKCICAKWVENEAVEILLCASRKPEEFSILTINTKEQDEIQQYLNRARIEIRSSTVVAFPVSGGVGYEDIEIIWHIEKSIYKYINECINKLDIQEDNEVEAFIRKCIHDKILLICALPSEYAKERILEKLCDKYPGIIFIVQVKSESEASESLKNIRRRPLCPMLNEDKYAALKELRTKLSLAKIQEDLGE